MKRFSLFVGTVLAAFGLAAAAQTIANVTVEPTAAKVGEPVKITVNFDKADAIGCNVRVYFGDGGKQDNKINQDKDVPKTVTHTYTKAGDFTVKAEGKTALPLPKCSGVPRSAVVKVAALAPAASAGPSCPDGWKLDAKSVSKKSGAYTCTAKAGTTLPTAKAECPSPLGYFENKSKGQLGCKL
jgi:plastocyanin